MAPPQCRIDPKRDFSIAIIGGGIGGLCTAIGLLQKGIEVEIYESAPAFSEIGAGLGLGPNASHALNLLNLAAYDAFLKIRTNNASPDRQRIWGSFRIGDDGLGQHIIDLPCETGQSSVHRATFLNELVSLIPKEIAHFGKKLVNFQDTSSSVTLSFADSTTCTHTAVIACDGIKSTTRSLLLGPSYSPTFSGKYAYRALIPMSLASFQLGNDLARNTQLYLGHGGHVLTYPIEHGETMNVVAFGTKEEWEGDEWVEATTKEEMMGDFEGWIEPVQKILKLLGKSPRWACFDLPPAPTYFKNNVCLLGDAAHATTPHLGAGAGMAIEDAVVMAAALGQVYDGRDIPNAFETYDQLRRPRSQELVRESRLMGLLYDLQAPGIEDDVEKVRDLFATGDSWVWEYDIGLDVERAKAIMEKFA